MIQRPFPSYEAYVDAQGRKAREQRPALLASLEKSIASFQNVFRTAGPHLRPGPILCLGARTGAEVIAAHRVGFTGSIGVDLHPVGRSVLRADWHDLPFADRSFTNVYTNSFDHCFDLPKATAQIRRVLAAAGVFYLMASDKGTKTDATARKWLDDQVSNEAIYWQQSDELCAAVVDQGFRQVRAWRSGCWGHYILTAR